MNKNNFKHATSIRFGRSHIYIEPYGEFSDVVGIQTTFNSKSTVQMDLADCRRKKELENNLRSLLRGVSTDRVIMLGFSDGMLALAEMLIIDASATPRRVCLDIIVRLFGFPKIYCGEIQIDDMRYKIEIYDSHYLPGTKSTTILK